jgi:hypothetical protein
MVLTTVQRSNKHFDLKIRLANHTFIDMNSTFDKNKLRDRLGAFLVIMELFIVNQKEFEKLMKQRYNLNFHYTK